MLKPARLCCICSKPTDSETRYLPNMQACVCSNCRSKGKEPVPEAELENVLTEPWTTDQTKSLAAYQRSRSFLPFVCAQDHILVARANGLQCGTCRFTQQWTYDWTLDWTWKKLEPPDDDPGVPARIKEPDPSGSTEVTLPLPPENEEPDDT